MRYHQIWLYNDIFKQHGNDATQTESIFNTMTLLANYRTHPELWPQIASHACNAVQEDEDPAPDHAALTRYQLLLAIQYDWRASDHALVRYLFEQEIIAEENDGYSGMYESFYLAAYLLAKYREPSDIPLFYRAKYASFDKACAFGLEYIYFALEDATGPYLQQHFPDLYLEMQERYDSLAAPDDLQEQWQFLVTQYPENEADEEALTLFWRCLDLKKESEARQHLVRWETAEPESKSKTDTLISAYRQLGDYRTVLDLMKSMPPAITLWDRASRLESVIELHYCAGLGIPGMQHVMQLDSLFAQFSDWKNCGLGRMAVHETLKLTQIIDDMALARQVFVIAENWLRQCSHMPFIGLEAAEQAARHCALPESAERYRHLKDEERRRIDQKLAG